MQAYSEKRNPSAPLRSRTQDLPITSSDALPLSYRRLVGAKAIKLGSEFVPEEPSAVVQEETSGDAILEAEQVMNLTTESSTRLITIRKLQTEICT